MSTKIGTCVVLTTHRRLAETACHSVGIKFPVAIDNLARILANIESGVFTLTVALTQSGKSGLQLALIHSLPHLLKKTVGAIWLLNKSSTSLREQMHKSAKKLKLVDHGGTLTNERDLYLRMEMLSGGFWSDRRQLGRIKDHHNSLIMSGVDIVVVIIMDEAHIAVKEETQIANLMKVLGVDSPQELTYFFGFTATPEIYLKGDIHRSAPVTIVPCFAGVGYTGLRELVESRIFTFTGFKNLKDFQHLVPKGRGFVLFRADTKSAASIENINALAKARGATVDIFSSKPDHRPISQLKEFLDTEPGKSTRYVVILAALSAGDDLVYDGNNLRRNFLAVFSARFNSSMAAAQDIGRCTGYKFAGEETFPIYVTEKGYDSLIENLETVEAILNNELPVTGSYKQHSPALAVTGKLIPCTAKEYTFWFNDYVKQIKPDALMQMLTSKGRDGDKIFQNLENGNIGAAAWARISFQIPPKDPVDRESFYRLKNRYGISEFAHFEILVQKSRTTKTILNRITD